MLVYSMFVNRPLPGGKSLRDVIANGDNRAIENACYQLALLVLKEQEQRLLLDRHFENRKRPPFDVWNYGVPMLNEND